jgi:hypothetical protein
LPRGLAGFKRNRAIQKPRLAGELHGLGLIKRRYRNHAAGPAQPTQSVPQVRFAIADI